MFKASTDDELDAAFQAMGTLRADGLAVAGESFFDSRRQKIVTLAGQAFEHGFQQRSDVELNLGAYVGRVAGKPRTSTSG